MFQFFKGAAQIERLQRFTRISRGLTQLHRSTAIYEMLVYGAMELIECERIILLMEQEQGRFSPVRAVGIDDPLVELEDVPMDPALRAKLAEILGEPLLAVPLVHDGTIRGVLALQCDKREEEDDAWLLSALLDHGALALRHARMLEQDEDRLRNVLPEAFDSEEQRQFLMSAMAHDLRSPLLSIRMGCDLLEDTIGELSDEQKEIFGHIRMARGHVETVAENLLEMGRLSAGMSVFDCRKVNLDVVLDEALSVLGPEARNRKCACARSGADRLLVHADGPRLRQALVNLVGNAIKYGPDGATVRIETRNGVKKGYHSVLIADDGPGIPEAEQEDIFAPYYRCLEGGKPRKSGVGLGLAISRELVRKMGGDITVSSKPGHGATFTVTLPVAR